MNRPTVATTLEDFVRSHLPDRVNRLEAIEFALQSVLDGFSKLWDGANERWPYKVEEPLAVNAAGLSTSTNAMVLFMLKAFARESPPRSEFGDDVALVTPLLAAGGYCVDFPRSLKKPLKQTIATLQQSVDEAAKTSSGTYGDNDPLTLTWLCECGITLKDPLPTTVKEAVTAALKKPDQYVLDEQHNNAAPHAFPLLRMVQLERKVRDSDDPCRPICNLGQMQSWFEARLHLHLSYSQIPDSSMS